MTQALEKTADDGLDQLLDRTPCLWKGRQPNHVQAVLPSGDTRLDRHLPGGGWPRGAVSELISERPGLGEFSLLFPALAAAGREGRWLLLVDPPWVPYPAALHGNGLDLEQLLVIRSGNHKESLWACEQALRSMPGSIVLAWPDEIRFAALRRLQLAAESRGATSFLFRPGAAASASSPAALRIKLDTVGDAMRIEILKCRGSRPAHPLLLQPPHCSQRGHHEASPGGRDAVRALPTHLAGRSFAAPGAGLPHPGPGQAQQPHRHH